MKASNVIWPGIVGTSVMTAYSFYLSGKKKRDFREPHLLATLIFRMFSQINKRQSKVAGWVIHYLVGIFFAAIYLLLIKRHLIKTTISAAAIVGALSGMVGIAAWSITLNLHPHPPVVNRRQYYGQLVVAHIIFGIISILVLRRKRNARPAIQDEVTRPVSVTY